MTEPLDSLKARIEALGLKIGNEVLESSTGLATSVSKLLYVDSDKRLAGGNIPFMIPMHAGVTDTSYAAMEVKGSSTLSADEIMHQTLVAGAGVTTFTKTGFIRVKIVDSAGNLTDGYHYIQIGTLS